MNKMLHEYAQFLKGFSCQVTDQNYRAFENSKQLLERLSKVENSSMTVFDMATGKYAFTRTKFDEHICYPQNDDYKMDPFYFFQLMPEPDARFAVDTVTQGFAFIHEQPGSVKKEFKLVFEFRLSDPAGNLYRFLQQCVVLELDPHGNIWMVLIINDLVPNRSVNSPLLRKMIHIPSGEIRMFHDDPEKASNRMLSKRETEILGLLSQGLQSKEISDKLFISINTVNNHRQKIIEKLNTENTHEALIFARQIGII